MTYRVEPYMTHYDEELPCEAGDKPEFWRVWKMKPAELVTSNGTIGDDRSWVADFENPADANEYVAFKTTQKPKPAGVALG